MASQKKKPQSAKSKAAQAKREKTGMVPDTVIPDSVRQRLEDSYEKTWGKPIPPSSFPSSDTGWIDTSYPSTASLEEKDLLTAEEAIEQEERILGKRGTPDVKTFDILNDELPDFLQSSAKAGPPLDHLGRTQAERDARIGNLKEERQKNLPVIFAGKPDNDIPKRTVTIMRDHDLEYPDLYMSVFLAPDWGDKAEAPRMRKWLVRSGCYESETLEDADLVVFGGGSDIEPLLYGENNAEKHEQTYFYSERDAADMELYLQARDIGIPMVGICRGAQFLHVMNGGILFQHVEDHYGSHKAYDLVGRELIENVSSSHHQMCAWNPEMQVVLTTTVGGDKPKWLNRKKKDETRKPLVEAFYYRDSGCLGFQGHPEYSGCNKYSVWCLEQIDKFFLQSIDFEWAGSNVRMTKTARDAQKIAAQYVENAYNQSKEV